MKGTPAGADFSMKAWKGHHEGAYFTDQLYKHFIAWKGRQLVPILAWKRTPECADFDMKGTPVGADFTDQMYKTFNGMKGHQSPEDADFSLKGTPEGADFTDQM